jgi:hypothetical protein
MPNRNVQATLTIENIGDDSSLLDWEITSWPEWGSWQFDELKGYDLKPEDGQLSIEITVTAPEEGAQEFIGEVIIENNENSNDYETIEVILKTPRNKAIKNPLYTLLNNNLNLFSLIRLLLQLH